MPIGIVFHGGWPGCRHGGLNYLTGQIAAESIGHHLVSVSGGQLAFATGAQLSKGGRFITTLPSTAKDGKISRIVPDLISALS